MKKKAYFLTLLFFLYGIGVCFIHPLTPEYVNALGLESVYYGLFYSIMSFGMFTGSLFFGWMSKKTKRIYLLSIGIILYALSQLLFGFVNTNGPLILVWRFMGGFGVGAPLSFFATFANEVTKDKASRDKLILILPPVEIIGEAVGYKLGGFLHARMGWDFTSVFILQAAWLVVLSLIMFFLFFKDEVRPEPKIEAKTKEKHKFNPAMLVFFLIIMLATLSSIITTKYTEKYVIQLGYTSDDLGTIMMVTALVGVAASLIYSFLSKKIKFNYRWIHAVLLVISGVMILVTYLIPTSGFLIGVYTSYTIFYMCKVLISSTDTRIILENSNESNKGFNMGLRQASIASGNFVGPLIGGAIYDANNVWAFFASSIMFGVTFLISIIALAFKKKEKID